MADWLVTTWTPCFVSLRASAINLSWRARVQTRIEYVLSLDNSTMILTDLSAPSRGIPTLLTGVGKEMYAKRLRLSIEALREASLGGEYDMGE